VSSPPWESSPDSYAYIYMKKGTDDLTTFSDITSSFPSLWTADHRARGITQKYALYRSPGISTDKYLRLYQNGFPKQEILVRAGHFYDPRQSGHDIDDPLTWSWSENGIILTAYILSLDDSVGMDGIDWSDIALEADKADAGVSTKTGTEARARAAFYFGSNDIRRDVIDDMLRSIGARIVLSSAGLFQIRLIDDNEAAAVAFTDRDLISTQLSSGPEAIERPNRCILKYYSPERNYELAEIDLSGVAWANIEDEIERYGVKELEISLPFCPSASQAQRIARRLFAETRAETGVAVTNMAGLAAWQAPTASLPLIDDRAVETALLGPPRCYDDRGQVELPFVVRPTLTAYNPATDEADPPAAIPDLTYDTGLTPPAAPTQIIQVAQNVGSGTEMRIQGASPGSNTSEISYRTYDANGRINIWEGTVELSSYAYKAGDFTGQKIDARQRFYTSDDEASTWSNIYQVSSVAENNTACAAPNFTFTVNQNTTIDYDIDIDVYATELRAAYIVIERRIGSGAWTEVARWDVRPGDTKSYSDTTLHPSGSVQYRAATHTSNGTISSTYAQDGITRPN
jgi:hypothetical protein